MTHSLTRSYTALEGQVVFHMLPYATLKQDVILRALQQAGVYDLDLFASNTFLFLEGRTERLEFTGDLSDTALSLQAYWQGRGLNPVDNFQRFLMVKADAFEEIWAAYEATKEPLLEATVSEPEDVKKKLNGSNKPGKRGDRTSAEKTEKITISN